MVKREGEANDDDDKVREQPANKNGSGNNLNGLLRRWP